MSSTSVMPLTLHEERDLQPSSLYIVFLCRDNSFSLDSALFFASPDVRLLGRAGRIWHATRGTVIASGAHRENQDWLYEETTAAEVSLQERLILAVRIADLAYLGPYQDVANSIEKVVSQASVRAYFQRVRSNYRDWLLNAVQALHETAYLYCPSIGKLDAELERLVSFAVQRHWEEKRFFIVVSECCAGDEG